ncbi:MAG: hypothetical protein COU63_01105 [Candidatus Pacebacteria bacterium CG10_big_fil_rev_8_21_14_0_10_36_11]|nr:hypothetical protein [Candidatus Pacearchaeota archaeon]OIP73813.1 MAG: hypothetical protein AUK08_04615 [Candidatus Pacebacteria bacterium CG2_30_36_39]PIR64601.1 MAG: hypothetical protein COU63_01105 [Candidatus Pacebacteria bacterium CG10_big_fil_rev_8_21_14_0_10_36_11]
MSKTTKKAPTRTKKIAGAEKKQMKKIPSKAAVKPVAKKVSKVIKTVKKPVTKTVVSKVEPMMKMANPLINVQKFFSKKKNVVLVLGALLIMGVVYLAKDQVVVAMVNGKPIYRWTMINKLEEQGGKQVLDSLIVETLVRQAIDKSKVTVDQVDIDAAIKELEDRIVAQGLTLDAALQEQGMTRAALIEDIVMQKSAEKIVADKVVVTDDEISQYLKDNADYFPADSDPESFRETVRQQIYSSKLNQEIQTWVQGLQDEAKIIYLKEYDTKLTNK